MREGRGEKKRKKKDEKKPKRLLGGQVAKLKEPGSGGGFNKRG